MITIWHNPRCSKSRATLALLEGKGDVTVRRYLEDAPTAEEIRGALSALGLHAKDILRTSESEAKAIGLTKSDSEDRMIAAMVDCPKLIERPIVFAHGQARIGRPPEQVLEIL